MSKIVRVDCKGETTIAQNICDTMKSFIKRNFPGDPKVPHTAVKVTSQNCVEFPEEKPYLAAFEQARNRTKTKFTINVI